MSKLNLNNNDLSVALDPRSEKELVNAIGLMRHTVYKSYLPELHSYSLIKPSQVLLDQDPSESCRFFKLEKLTCIKGENIFQKLTTVYHASMSLGCTLVIMVDVKAKTAPADIYLGVRAKEGLVNTSILNTSSQALVNGIKSNFPGTSIRNIGAQTELPYLLNDIFNVSQDIASVSCIAATRDKYQKEDKTFTQGIEKFIDTMRACPYTAIFVAEPIVPETVAEIRYGYEELYTTLSSFAKSIWSYNENESSGIIRQISKGLSKTITDSIGHTQAHTINIGVNAGISQGNSTSQTKQSPTGWARVGQAVQAFGQGAALLNPVAGAIAGAVGGALSGSSTAKTISNMLGMNGGVNAGYAATGTKSETRSESDTYNQSISKGNQTTNGTGRTVQIETINKQVSEMLHRIDEQLKRIKEVEDYGAFNCGAYFLSDRLENVLLAANTYRALMMGESSSIETGAVNFWEREKESEIVDTMKEYLKRFSHPIFAKALQNSDDREDYQLCPYTAGTVVSGLELPLHMGVPTKSVYGLPVVEQAEFGRNVEKAQDAIVLGELNHMGDRLQVDVCLSKQYLTSHTFVTGSTGSGKSNTIYRMLEEICLKEDSRSKFLVIEPAKGEYKKILGGYDEVSVFSTNAKMTPLLRINPFSFPEEIQVLEHIDRITEVFNACWPMYAAMPAVLKDAIEESYKRCGWSLKKSVNPMHEFPTFATVLEVLPDILKKSSYSDDTRNDYEGALVTRIRSLTNGINGIVFCSDNELSDSILFDQNVIVDLSRIGSAETKALVMGILIIKLQEYHMSQSKDNDAELTHVTVLEEAHQLLRNTTFAASQESSNVQGQSVEMLANAIAEMRTYGEGFIIADQAPGLLERSVIRNTNTKIIMRLPDESDRIVVGKAAGLNDEQIKELAKLDTGVAAVYQNNWKEALLCNIRKFEKQKKFCNFYTEEDYDVLIDKYIQKTMGKKIVIDKRDVERLKQWLKKNCRSWILNDNQKLQLFAAADKDTAIQEEDRGDIYYVITGCEDAINRTHNISDIEEMNAVIEQQIEDALPVSNETAVRIRNYIVKMVAERIETAENDDWRKRLLMCGSIR